MYLLRYLGITVQNDIIRNRVTDVKMLMKLQTKLIQNTPNIYDWPKFIS